ncbi:hypothetical protein PPYR_01892 [Photinus pyralis]|uniref:Uncharacterized protein n=1 Tax=Photinus pyralis TaxID=7054 RepID=A0A1Y1L605_PHOPY|nr:allergen Tha p 1-like [Photinus pyralis]KAB0804922.1 hypothetical protein PPYR_01892 [Photinus pyralis]
MKTLLVVLFFAIIAAAWARPKELYTDEFDNIDEDAILASKRLVDNYIHCAKTGKKCSPDGQKFRDLIPQALKTRCEKCTETQKTKIKKILKWIVENRPNDFLEIEALFDKTHEYRTLYADELKKENIILPALKKA